MNRNRNIYDAGQEAFDKAKAEGFVHSIGTALAFKVGWEAAIEHLENGKRD